jgi:phosphoserine phosphatase
MAILTLVAKPATILNDQWLDNFTGQLSRVGCRVVMQHWLAPNEAIDLKIEQSVGQIVPIIGHQLDAQPLDWFVQEETNRRKKFLLADMESTIIQQEMLDEMADAIDARAKVASITALAMNGELDFVAALRARVALFKGQPEKLLHTIAARITPMAGATTLVATMNNHGAQCWLASGGFRHFTRQVAAQLGFARETGNDLIIEQGILTGAVAEPIQDKNSKLEFFNLALRILQMNTADTITVGDGANDLPMLHASSVGGGLGVAYHAKPAVNAVVQSKVQHTDLTALLYAQGYQRSEFAF